MTWFFVICAILVALAFLAPNPKKEPESLRA